MICYRDQTYCVANCSYLPCSIKYTQEVVDAATLWWGSQDAPIALSDYSDTCEYYKEKPCSFDTSETTTQQ